MPGSMLPGAEGGDVGLKMKRESGSGSQSASQELAEKMLMYVTASLPPFDNDGSVSVSGNEYDATDSDVEEVPLETELKGRAVF